MSWWCRDCGTEVDPRSWCPTSSTGLHTLLREETPVRDLASSDRAGAALRPTIPTTLPSCGMAQNGGVGESMGGPAVPPQLTEAPAPRRGGDAALRRGLVQPHG
jgi:hypothetical protein